MQLSKYELKTEKSFMIFEFVSVGPKGSIVKTIQFMETNLNGFYNLAFGDIDPVTGILNDRIVTNNGDTEKVLATIVESIFIFTENYPDTWIYATGSTNSRTRLYRMGINKYFNEVNDHFYIFGERENEWLIFEKNENYEGFAVKRKFN